MDNEDLLDLMQEMLEDHRTKCTSTTEFVRGYQKAIDDLRLAINADEEG